MTLISFFQNMQIEITKWGVALLLTTAVATAATAGEHSLDSIPLVQKRSGKSERTLQGVRDGKRLEFTLTNGELTALTVDGRHISKSEFSQYGSMTNSIIADMDAHERQSPMQLPEVATLPQIGEPMVSQSAIDDKAIMESLKQDGLVRTVTTETTIKMTARQMWVNGKSVSEDLFPKYKRMMEAQRGRQVCSACEIEVTIQPNEGRF